MTWWLFLLQWGRGIGIHAKGKRVNDGLQWGRDHVIAESTATYAP
jgi:hypothetical protein